MKTIEEKIETAARIMRERKRELLTDKVLGRLLADYDAAITHSAAVMQKFHLGETCGRCATSVKGGGCCGNGIDEWYDHYLVLMNMMLGVKLPERRMDGTSCFFLGDKGCSIRARYHFCVNYLCYRITGTLKQEELLELSTTSGNELYLSWQVELRLRELGI